MTGNFVLSASAGEHVPWSADADSFFKHLREVIPSDVAAAAIWSVDRPSLDELLAARGLNATTVSRWCREGFKQDAMLREAMRKGVSVVTTDKISTGSGLVRHTHSLMAMASQSTGGKRWWWLMLARSGKPFTETEQALAQLIVQRWHVAFHQPRESRLTRLIVGHDDRLLLADLGLQRQLLRTPSLVDQLLGTMHPVLAQRYEKTEDQVTRDLAVELAGEPTWVCARPARALTNREAAYWYIELRPLDKDELPTIGVVEDPRVAVAIAYLHDNYRSTPGLVEVAKAVHTSPFHFHRIFSRHVGVSPKHYLMRKQLQMAKWMLRSTRMPISLIAQETGFASHGHFTSTFHRAVGVSPSDYRDANAE